jgi:hypothetical protein
MRRMTGWILAGVLLAASVAARGGEAEPAETASRTWLAIVDSGKYGESWVAAAAFFRKSLTKPRWEAAVEKARSPLGRVVTRRLSSSHPTTQLPGAPAGEYVVLQYATDFENRQGMTETVTPMKDPDGTWRVSGYYIQ